MKNKQLVLKKIEQLKNDVRTIQTLLGRGGTYDELFKAFQTLNERIENTEDLIDAEIDPFKSNQIL